MYTSQGRYEVYLENSSQQIIRYLARDWQVWGLLEDGPPSSIISFVSPEDRAHHIKGMSMKGNLLLYDWINRALLMWHSKLSSWTYAIASSLRINPTRHVNPLGRRPDLRKKRDLGVLCPSLPMFPSNLFSLPFSISLHLLTHSQLGVWPTAVGTWPLGLCGLCLHKHVKPVLGFYLCAKT